MMDAWFIAHWETPPSGTVEGPAARESEAKGVAKDIPAKNPGIRIRNQIPPSGAGSLLS